MAFVSSASVTTSVFSGTRTLGHASTLPVRPSSVTRTTTPSMTIYTPISSIMKKYETLATTPVAFYLPRPAKEVDMGSTTATVLPPSTTSSIWVKFVAAMTEGILPSYGSTTSEASYKEFMTRLQLFSRPFNAPGGSPTITTADNYMSSCITAQLKQTACSTGVYSVTCTEGTVKLQADQSRVLSEGAAFRRRQRSTSAKYADFFESRKQANIIAHGCSYEESLYSKLPGARAAAVQAYAEATAACSRSALPTDPAEAYMMRSVERQCKERAVPGGVYTVACGDGQVKDLAEEKRVLGLGAKFRAAQIGNIAKLQQRRDRSKWARDMYAHGCSYEEDLFNKYPSMAAAMSAIGARY